MRLQDHPSEQQRISHMDCYLFNFSLLGSNLRLQLHNLLRQTDYN